MKETKFKQTEVGMIPRDWEVYPLGSFIKRMEAGVSVNSNESFFSENYVLKTSAVHNGVVNCKEVKAVVKRDTNRLKCPLRADCLIVSRMNTPELVGECAYSETNAENVYLPDRLWLIPNERKNNISFRLLNYILGTPIMRYAIKGTATGTSNSMKNISKGKFLEISVPLPPTIEEQQRIAAALSDVDTLINNLEKLIAKKKNIKQGTMQQLLTGRKRLPGFAPAKPFFKQTELGPIPEDWDVKTFGDLFDILPNNTLSRAELNDEKGSYKNVHYGDVLVKFQEWIDCSKNSLPFINSGAKFNHTILQDGDVIIADTAEDETVGKSTEIVNVENLKIVSGLHTIPIRPKVKFASKWLGYFINSVCWHNQILPFITGTKVSAISKAAVAQTKFFYPAKIAEQTAIATVLSDMDTEIQTLETKLAKYRKLKTGMMQQLLTGKIRLV